MAMRDGPTRYDLGRDELGSVVEEIAPGAPSYRVSQVWDGLHRRLLGPDELTELPRPMRAALGNHPALAPALALDREWETDGGRTRKWVWRLSDGGLIETVLMHYDASASHSARSTVCVSTQAGCAMACSFCATGQAGFDRHLSVGEIVEQVARAARSALADDRKVSRVVFMGMGEPLANYDATVAAARRMHEDLGLSARHLTISTVGVVPGIRRLATEGLPFNLAVSLHAANDAKRDSLVPLNRRYPLAVLAAACAAYLDATHRRLSLEWALIDGVNDGIDDVRDLTAFARPLGAHVNIIPLNPTPGYAVLGTPPLRVRRFAEQLQAAGINATVRKTRGREIDAACGQLAAGRAVREVGAPVRIGHRR
ncbi:MAG: 23S rRNA (adenine(2503)-C(2))-methyltransferase RlmN [Acidimicrobiales bacterium]